MKNNPLVSVIIPTNNRNEKLITCINSVLKNTYKNIEILVVNDSPENDVKNLLKNYKKIIKMRNS